MHDMRTDLRTGIIEVDFIGFWQPDDFVAYRRDLADHAARLNATGRSHMQLIDYTRASIQSQEVVAMLGNLVTHIERPSRRVAIFTTGQCARLQAKRIAALRDDIRVFDDRESARNWLMELVEHRYARPAGSEARAI